MESNCSTYTLRDCVLENMHIHEALGFPASPSTYTIKHMGKRNSGARTREQAMHFISVLAQESPLQTVKGLHHCPQKPLQLGLGLGLYSVNR